MTSYGLHICSYIVHRTSNIVHRDMPTETDNNISDQKENEFLQCLQSNDQRQFSVLYDAFSAALFGLIVRWIGDAIVAENLLQDVFVKAWRNRAQYDPSKGRLFTWLYNIARNSCIDHLRSKTYKQESKTSALNANSQVLLPSVIMILPDTIGLRTLVSKLRQEEKKMIELKYFNGLTQEEIAEALNMPLGTVKTRINMAIKNLRNLFNKDWELAIQNMSLN